MLIAGNEVRYDNGDAPYQYPASDVPSRFMIPSVARRAWDQNINTQDRKVLHFLLKPGEYCPDDSYDLGKQRAYRVFDVDHTKSRPVGVPVRARFDFNIMPSRDFTSWWFTFWQANQYPGTSGGWASPACSLDRIKDSSGEYLALRVRYKNSAGVWQTVVVGQVPFQRARQSLEIIFKNSNGGQDGYAQLKINGLVINEYNGPTGAAGQGGSYNAYGIYRAMPNADKYPDDIAEVLYENYYEETLTA